MKESFHKKSFVINATFTAGKKSKIVKPNRQAEEKNADKKNIHRSKNEG